MAGTFTASIRGFSEKAKRNIELVVKQSAQDVFEIAQTPVGSSAVKPKKAKIGVAPFIEGRLPVDTGFLRNSFIATINGSQVSSGEDAYVLAIASFELGDVIFGGWGASYALEVEYGANGVPPRFFMRGAAQQWQSIVNANAAKLRD